MSGMRALERHSRDPAEQDMVVKYARLAPEYDALCEMRRVLRPGGRLIVTDWCDDYLACRVCSRYLRLFGDNIKVYRRRECLRLLQEAGYREAEVERYRISWLWGLMTATGSR